MLIIDDKKIKFEKMLYIYYLIWIYQDKICALFYNGNKIYIINFSYSKKLDLRI